jgi:hypothetical protein
MGMHQERTKNQRTIKTFLKMELTILKVQYVERISRNDKVKVSVNGLTGKKKFEDVPKGEYALIKLESLNDRFAVEKFIEQLKNK